MSKQIDSDKIKTLINNLSSSLDEKDAQIYKSIIEKSPIKDFSSPKGFELCFLYPFSVFVKTHLKNGLKLDRKSAFIWENYSFVEDHFAGLFKDYEGHTLCFDKAANVINKLLKFFSSGEKVDFSQSAYAKPRRILTTHDEVVEMYEAINSLKYGNGKPYILAMKNLIDNIKVTEDGS
jgi:hypothetical protein